MQKAEAGTVLQPPQADEGRTPLLGRSQQGAGSTHRQGAHGGCMTLHAHVLSLAALLLLLIPALRVEFRHCACTVSSCTAAGRPAQGVSRHGLVRSVRLQCRWQMQLMLCPGIGLRESILWHFEGLLAYEASAE